MALSMSAVAFARDTQPENSGLQQGPATGDSGDGDSQIMGLPKTYIIDPSGTYDNAGNRTPAPITINGHDFDLSSTALADAINDNLVTVDLSVTSGKNELTGNPRVSARENGNTTITVTFKDKWGTGSSNATMRIRITAKKDVYISEDETTIGTETQAGANSTIWLPKGDTITLEPFSITAAYEPVTAYGENMTVTNTEVEKRNIVATGEELYNNADSNDKVIVYFKNGGYDVAAYEVKVASNQKSVNLAFNNNEIANLASDYDKVEFEFITFEAYNAGSGANRFNNSGTMYFNAIGGDDTAVYEYADGVLTKLDGKYDSVDKTIAVNGIKHLTSYVVASEELTEEEPEEEDSSSSAPTDEVPSTPANPSTGAL